MNFAETSTLSNKNVTSAFEKLLHDIYANRKNGVNDRGSISMRATDKYVENKSCCGSW